MNSDIDFLTESVANRLRNDIGCLPTEVLPATLINSNGFHCDVWRSLVTIRRADVRRTYDIVTKVFRQRCSFPELAMYNRHYQWLRDRLGEMVPPAIFVATEIDGQVSVIVIAETVDPWFNLANPVNESHVLPMLAQMADARAQLRQFIDAANDWQQDSTPRIIDLYGNDNLILDHGHQVRYIDSFAVFLIADLDQMTDDDDEFQRRIAVAKKRLDYLRYLWHSAESLATSEPQPTETG